MLWIVVAYCLIGVLVGYLTGASNSPVVGVVIPAIFTLIGGAGSVYLLNMDFKIKESAFKFKIIGISTSFFVLTFIIGLLVGVATRSPYGWAAIFPRSTVKIDEIAVDEIGETKDNIELILLRRKLQMLGATESEVNKIVVLARKEFNNKEKYKTAKALIDSAINDVEQMRTLFDKLKDSSVNSEMPIDFWLIEFRLEEMLTPLKTAALDLDHAEHEDAAVFIPAIEKAESYIYQMRDDSDLLKLLKKNEVKASIIVELEIKLQQIKYYLSPVNWSSGSDFSDRLDGFIEKITRTKQLQTSSLNLNQGPGRGLASN